MTYSELGPSGDGVVRQAVERLEDWGIDHLGFVVAFSVVLSVVAFLIVVTLAVLT